MAMDAQRFAAMGDCYQQAQRWLRAGCFEALAEDLRVLLRLSAGHDEQPRAAIIDSRT